MDSFKLARRLHLYALPERNVNEDLLEPEFWNVLVAGGGCDGRGVEVQYQESIRLEAGSEQRDQPVDILGGVHRQDEPGRNPVCAGPQSGRQHSQRVGAAAPRGGADQRFPARRVAR